MNHPPQRYISEKHEYTGYDEITYGEGNPFEYFRYDGKNDYFLVAEKFNAKYGSIVGYCLFCDFPIREQTHPTYYRYIRDSYVCSWCFFQNELDKLI